MLGEDELGALARSFNQMAQTLAEMEERRRELIGDVTHELRTPLASMRSLMEGLVDGVLPPNPATFHQVEQEVTRLQRLVQDLEALSRAEAGQLLLERQPVDPAALPLPGCSSSTRKRGSASTSSCPSLCRPSTVTAGA